MLNDKIEDNQLTHIYKSEVSPVAYKSYTVLEYMGTGSLLQC